MRTRRQGANLLALGLACWAINLTLALTTGWYGLSLVVFGGIGIFGGAVLLVWGDSFRSMSPAQKVPAALIALTAVAAAGVALLRWAQHLSAR
jgi:hypothetical protein